MNASPEPRRNGAGLITLSIHGMTCTGCVATVERAGYRAAPRADTHRVDRERERIQEERANRLRLLIALAAADLGIAIGSGTDVAIEAADVALVKGSLALIADALDLSRRTVRTIRQNLLWAFAHNVLAIPVSASALYPMWGLLLHPTIASAAMAMSSVSVVPNGLRLARWRGARA